MFCALVRAVWASGWQRIDRKGISVHPLYFCKTIPAYRESRVPLNMQYMSFLSGKNGERESQIVWEGYPMSATVILNWSIRTIRNYKRQKCRETSDSLVTIWHLEKYKLLKLQIECDSLSSKWSLSKYNRSRIGNQVVSGRECAYLRNHKGSVLCNCSGFSLLQEYVIYC